MIGGCETMRLYDSTTKGGFDQSKINSQSAPFDFSCIGVPHTTSHCSESLNGRVCEGYQDGVHNWTRGEARKHSVFCGATGDDSGTVFYD